MWQGQDGDKDDRALYQRISSGSGSSAFTDTCLPLKPQKRKVGRPKKDNLDPDAPRLSEADRRKIRRRLANRESARRVRAKHHEELEQMQLESQHLRLQNKQLEVALAAAEASLTTSAAQLAWVQRNCVCNGLGGDQSGSSSDLSGSNFSLPCNLPALPKQELGLEEHPVKGPTICPTSQPGGGPVWGGWNTVTTNIAAGMAPLPPTKLQPRAAAANFLVTTCASAFTNFAKSPQSAGNATGAADEALQGWGLPLSLEQKDSLSAMLADRARSDPLLASVNLDFLLQQPSADLLAMADILDKPDI